MEIDKEKMLYYLRSAADLDTRKLFMADPRPFSDSREFFVNTQKPPRFIMPLTLKKRIRFAQDGIVQDRIFTPGEVLFCRSWGDGAAWLNQSEANAPHEANFLKLDCSKMKTTFGWCPHWHIAQAVEKTIEWTKAWRIGKDLYAEMTRQIDEYNS